MYRIYKWMLFIPLLWGVLIVRAPNIYAKAAGSVMPTMQGFEKGETGQVYRVIDGDTFVLNSGLRVNLASIQAPKMAWPDKEYKAWPLAQDSKKTLERLLRGKTVQLYYRGDQRDRYNRAQAQVWILGEQGKNIKMVQEEMLLVGMARVYPWPHKRWIKTSYVDVLYKSESKARISGLGIWDETATGGFYAVRSPEPNKLVQHVDSLQTVQGIIISTARVRDTIYMNFGADYKTDFTIGISKKALKSFKKAGYDPLALVGAKVRVRGWVELQNGPIIWLNTPERLEILN